MKLLAALHDFLGACHIETGHFPAGIVMPDALYDKLREEMGPRLVVVSADNAGMEEMRISNDYGTTYLRRVPVTRATIRL